MFKKSIALLLLLIGATGLPADSFGQSEPVKPYVLFIFDTSGSMGDPVQNSVANSCDGDTSKLSHAKCAVQRIINGFGEMTMGLGRFSMTTSDNNASNGCSQSGQTNCSGTDTPDDWSADKLQVLVPILENNQTDLLKWVDFTADTCYQDNTMDPELFDAGSTPIGGSLRGAKRYFQGLNTPSTNCTDCNRPYWTGPGDDPIRDDPLKNVFVNGEQCRPYIVVSLTDGDETCENFNNGTVVAAADLLTTDVDGQTYRIETIPIGFGKNPGDSEIEGLAHAGGATNVPGQNEGFYAQNEEELAIAIGDIIADNLKFESCNGVDDDCDVLIDEDFPGKGMACDDGQFGVCNGTGTFVCSADGKTLECNIDNPGQQAGTEVCNGIDDDCDNKIDEGGICTGCDPVEQCDNMDNDCDGNIDENLVRDCGSNVGECVAGTQTCNAGQWSNCNGEVGPTPETCDGLDNNCDSVIDGFSESCTTLQGNTGNGECQEGTRVCPSDGSGQFGPCLGEVGPTAEACDTLDNDCDNDIDEDTGGANCDGQCGTGTTECQNGMIVCNSTQMPQPETCNGMDDDCDGTTDEGIPDNGPCDPNGDLCMPGTLRCVGGSFQCIGGVPPDPEICDCIDNDCDNQTDEGSLCSGNQQCVDCQCASPCSGGEFPCPSGLECKAGFCVIDKCFGVNCQPNQDGDKMVCDEGNCVRACDSVTCVGNFRCKGSLGLCVEDHCGNFPDLCADNEFCIENQCVTDACDVVDCEDDEYCTGGTCYKSCGPVTCPEGERCRFGQCEIDPCGEPCRPPQVCIESTGTCENDPCQFIGCPIGQRCDPQTTDCEDDKCLGVECPNEGESCVDGSCYTQEQINQSQFDYIAPGGGKACSGGNAGLWLLLATFGLALFWRKRRCA